MTSRELNELQPEELVRQVFESVTDVLMAHGRVEVGGFGTFELVRRKPRHARNPRTGDRVEVPERTHIRFKPTRSLQSRVAGSTQLPHD
jgi:integration host factor subunit beta